MNNRTIIKVLGFWLKNTKNINKIPPSLKGKINYKDLYSLNMQRPNLNDPSKIYSYKKELETEERDKEILKNQKYQIEFNRILALATIVLALGVFLELFLRLFENPNIIMGRSTFFEFVYIAIPIIIILSITIELIRTYYRLSFQKNKK